MEELARAGAGHEIDREKRARDGARATRDRGHGDGVGGLETPAVAEAASTEGAGAEGAGAEGAGADAEGACEAGAAVAAGPGSAAEAHVPGREVQRRLLAFARRFLSDRTEAEDVMQEALLRARHALPRLRSPDREEAWLFRICRHAAIDHRRARRVRQRVWLPLTDERAERVFVSPAPSSLAERTGVRAARTLRALPAHHRVLMSLHYERGLPQGTICQLTGLSTSALRVRLFRARGSLNARQPLEPENGLPPRHARGFKARNGAGR